MGGCVRFIWLRSRGKPSSAVAAFNRTDRIYLMIECRILKLNLMSEMCFRMKASSYELVVNMSPTTTSRTVVNKLVPVQF